MPNQGFQKNNSKQKARDFSVKIVTATEALSILQTIKKLPDQKIDEQITNVRSLRTVSENLTQKQRRLIVGIYVAVMSGFEQCNLSIICRGLGIHRDVWYSIVEGESLDKARLVSDWLEQLIKKASKSHLSSVMASMINQAEKGSVKHQELFYKVNGYLQPDANTGGLVVNFKTFRELPNGETAKTVTIVEENGLEVQNQGTPAGLRNVSTMPQEEIESLMPFITETEPMPEEKRPKPHGERYNKPNHFSGETLI